MNHRLATVLIGGITIAGGLSACHGGPHPTYVVDSGLDAPDAVPGDGICDTGTGICTLRAAIDESNTLAGDDTATIELTVDVDLSIPGTLDNLNTTGDLDITHTVLINGQGHTINAHQLDRVIDHHTGDLTITDLTITGGDATGQTPSGRGGGLNIRDGDTIIANTTITNNISVGGGGISHRNAGNLNIYSSAITYNTQADVWPEGGDGGGIESDGATGDVTIQYTAIDHNSSTGETGGVAIGGGLGQTSDLIYIADSSISNNTADARGGLKLTHVNATIERTVIADNSAHIAAFDHFGGGEFVLVDSVVTGNTGSVLAVIGENDGFDILRSTIADNNVASLGLGIIFAPPNYPTIRPPGPGSIRQSTITGAAPNGMLLVETYSPPYDGELSLEQTVLQNTAGPTCGIAPDPYLESDLPVSSGHNWTSDTTCGFAEPTDIVGVDPMLGPLQNNGGPTQTMLPLAGSPLLDAIAWNTANSCDATTLTDQRGLPRPAVAATNCDIGAVERQPTDP